MVAVVVGEVSLPLPSSTKQVVERASDEGFRRGMVGLRRIPCKHRFLDACGLNRDWPDGRGIFHNDAKTFLVWINEEDQLRIISMQPGADILAVFSRLSIAAAEIEKVAKFAHDEHLGYITSCPTNLGTALRASVHIKLPNLCKDK